MAIQTPNRIYMPVAWTSGLWLWVVVRASADFTEQVKGWVGGGKQAFIFENAG